MMAEEDFEVDSSDLVYSGRDRKRPPGASDLVQRIYALLSEHPEGMTRDDIWEELREGWLETDAYRAYEKERTRRSRMLLTDGHRQQHSVPSRAPAEYGSERFKASAQRWWIRRKLGNMLQARTARHENDRWYAGAEVPNGWVPCKIKGGHLVPLNVAAQQATYRADTEAHVRREQIKARLREDLLAKRPSQKRLLETINLAYEYLSGR